VETDSPSTTDQIVLIHETVHALQDKAFDLKQLQESASNDDVSLAIEALIEGDATQGALLYAEENIPQVELLASASEAGELETEALERAPDFVSQMASFPYLMGQTFVQAIYDRQGLEGVNKLFENPPQSSEQILHPELYSSAHMPIKTSLTDIAKMLGAPWSELDRNVFGEFGLQLVLAEYLGPAAASAASAGWGGDEYVLLQNGQDQDNVLVIKTVWDNQEEAEEFWSLFITAMNHRKEYEEITESLSGEPDYRYWESDQSAVLMTQENKTITLAVGTDPVLLKEILQSAK
jgi:hypothetical protein